MHDHELTCLSYWFPKLVEGGIPVPRTKIIRWPGDNPWDLVDLCDGKTVDGFDKFISDLAALAKDFTYPIFLRTGQGSGKHDWKNTCYVEREADLAQHVFNLVEWSHMVDMAGLFHDVWVVREFLKLKTAFTLPRYGNMPLAREFRCFVRPNQVECVHPYWPLKAVEDGKPTEDGWKDKLDELSDLCPDDDAVIDLAYRVSKLFDGYWSVDVCQTEDEKWLVTDMAVGERSYHWEGCYRAPKK